MNYGPTLEEVSEWLRYDPETGLLYWVKSPNPRAKAGSVAGSSHSNGYVRVTLFRHQQFAHRLAFLLANRRWPNDRLDHINGNRADNRLSNLREASNRQNAHNQKVRSDSRSGLKGVTFHKQKNRWRAKIFANGKLHSLGYFLTPEEAHAAYSTAARLHFGEFARTE